MGFDRASSLPDRSLRECPAGDAVDMAEVEVVGKEGVVVARVTTRRTGRDPRGAATPAAATAPAVGTGQWQHHWYTTLWLEFVDRRAGLLEKPIFVTGSKPVLFLTNGLHCIRPVPIWNCNFVGFVASIDEKLKSCEVQTPN